MPQQQPQRVAPPKSLTIKDLSKKLEISSIDFTEGVRAAVSSEGKAPFLIFDQFASKLNFLDDKVSMRIRVFDSRISDSERKLYANCKKLIEKHRSKLVALFAENLNHRTKEIKQTSAEQDWAETIKSIREVSVVAQQIAKRGGFSEKPKFIEALKKFEQQAVKTILNKCVHIISQNENVQGNLSEQYVHINSLPMSNKAREDLKEEINKNYRKAFNENFKPS